MNHIPLKRLSKAHLILKDDLHMYSLFLDRIYTIN